MEPFSPTPPVRPPSFPPPAQTPVAAQPPVQPATPTTASPFAATHPAPQPAPQSTAQPAAHTAAQPAAHGSRANGRSRGLLSVGAAAVVALSLGAGYLGGQLSSSPSTAAATPAIATSLEVGGSLSVGAVLATVEPSVVSIETLVQSGRGRWAVEGSGAGTGIVLDTDGHILTNAHVIEGASSITVTVNGEERSATIVGSDSANDVAVLLLDDATGVTPAMLAGTDPAVGDEVVAVGNALALEGSLTVTSGIISAADRSIDTSNGTMTGLLQTDAAISSGNSGGPLVNSSGQVIGINTAVAASSTSIQASNIGFVIPIDHAASVAEALISSTAPTATTTE